MAPLLAAINRASRNNLVVVLAVCFGAALRVMLEQPHDRAPVFALIGPTDEISLGAFPRGFRAFYTALLEGGDGDAALNELNVEGAEKKPGSAYRLRTAEGAFRDRIRPVLAAMTRGSAKRTQVEAQLTQLLGTPWGQAAGVTAGRKAVKKVLTSGVEPAFNRVRDQYLMLDLFPEQAQRFTLSYKDCAPLSATESSR